MHEIHEFLKEWGHIPILALLSGLCGLVVRIAFALHHAGVEMTFDVRIWKNGKHPKE